MKQTLSPERVKSRGKAAASAKNTKCVSSVDLRKQHKFPRNHCSDSACAGWTFYGCLQYAHLSAGCSWRDGMVEATMGRKLGERELQAVITADG